MKFANVLLLSIASVIALPLTNHRSETDPTTDSFTTDSLDGTDMPILREDAFDEWDSSRADVSPDDSAELEQLQRLPEDSSELDDSAELEDSAELDDDAPAAPVRAIHRQNSVHASEDIEDIDDSFSDAAAPVRKFQRQDVVRGSEDIDDSPLDETSDTVPVRGIFRQKAIRDFKSADMISEEA